MKRLNIGSRLVASISAIVLLMAISSLVNLLQLNIFYGQAQRLHQTSEQMAAVIKVHNDVLLYKDAMVAADNQRGPVEFAAEVRSLQAAFERDVSLAIAAMASDVRQARARSQLESIRASLSAQADVITGCAALGPPLPAGLDRRTSAPVSAGSGRFSFRTGDGRNFSEAEEPE